MNAKQAKQIAYWIAANWIRSNQGDGCTAAAMKSRDPEGKEAEIIKVDKALDAIVASLEKRIQPRRRESVKQQ